MDQILVIEDSKFYSAVMKTQLESALSVQVHAVDTMAKAREVLARDDVNISLAIVDLVLPDSPDREVLDWIIQFNFPCIVFSSEFDDSIREKVLSTRVIDYVFKEDTSSLEYIENTVRRLLKNRGTKVLVVDDSRLAREYSAELLKLYQFEVLTANDGKEALEVLKDHPEILLVVTDYNMPNMDGIQLTKSIRQHHSRNELAVIGVSGVGNNTTSAKFLKSGGNDYLNKPFLREEFFCRVTQNIDFLENLAELDRAATRDFLTGLRNRRSFYDVGKSLYASGSRGQANLTLAMMDIDHFKSVNDTYGHDTGDVVLKRVAEVLQERCRTSDLVARLGGEEFCLICLEMGEDNLERYFRGLGEAIANLKFESGGKAFQVTMSFGVTTELDDSLDDMINNADKALYKAKEDGRNCMRRFEEI